MEQLIKIVQFVAEAVWQVWPLFLISITLSVLVRALKLDGLIRSAFSAHVGTAILLATLVGAFSPFCSCTVVPVIAGLLISGVPLAPIMSFWIASPTMDPEIFALSVGILGWPLALARLVATLGVSLIAGYLTWFMTRRGRLLVHSTPSVKWKKAGDPYQPESVPAQAMAIAVTDAVSAAGTTKASPGLACATGTCLAIRSSENTGSSGYRPAPRTNSWRNQLAVSWQHLDWRALGTDIVDQSWLLGRWLLLAFFMEAVITNLIPQEAIASMLGEQNLLAVPLAALIGIPLYLSNITALPVVSGLLSQGMQPGAAIAFLIAGPVTTIPAMTAVYGVVEKRIFTWYVGISLVGAVVMGLFTNWLLG